VVRGKGWWKGGGEWNGDGEGMGRDEERARVGGREKGGEGDDFAHAMSETFRRLCSIMTLIQ
jgi:hypothetical protein